LGQPGQGGRSLGNQVDVGRWAYSAGACYARSGGVLERRARSTTCRNFCVACLWRCRQRLRCAAWL